MTDDPASRLAQHVCRTGYADLPASAVESARRDILDTFGCMLGGSGSPGIGELFAVISRWGGLPESRVLLRGVRLPAPQAALLNASMGHALDFDDTLDTGGSIHPGVSVLGAVLALCDSLGRRHRTGCPVGRSAGARCFVPHRAREHGRSGLAPHGGDRGIRRHGGGRQADRLDAAANARRVRHRLQPCRRQSSMHSGRGTDQTDAGRPGGKCRRFLGGSGADRVHRAHNIFNGRFGFFELYQPNGYDASVLLRDLGTAFRGEALSYKPYPVRSAIARGDRRRAGGTSALADRAARRHCLGDDRGRSRRAQRSVRPRPGEAPPHPGCRGAIRATLSRRHRPGAWQGRHRRRSMVSAMPRFSLCRIGSPGSRRMADRKGRSASPCKRPTAARLPSRPPIPSARHKNRSRRLSSRQSSATARATPCSRSPTQVWMPYWRRSNDWGTWRMRES